MIETIRDHLVIIKPRTVTSLPFGATDHTEFCCTSTVSGASVIYSRLLDTKENLPSHVITAFLELNHGSTVEASLPTLGFGSFY